MKAVCGIARSISKELLVGNTRNSLAGESHMETENILDIIRKSKGKAAIISILEDIQEKYTYLPEEALRLVATETGCSLTDVYGVATFYKAFSLKPRGKHCVSACLGTACHVRGAETVVAEFKAQLNLEPGETTPDNEISFETVNCLGACALGPIVVSDGHYHANVTKREVKDIIKATMEGTHGSGGASKDYEFSFEASCPQCGQSLIDAAYRIDGHPSIRIDVMTDVGTGWMRIPSLYGNFVKILEHAAPEDALLTPLCPHCGANLQGKLGCLECNAPMGTMNVDGGAGIISICSRKGCNGHILTLNGATI